MAEAGTAAEAAASESRPKMNHANQKSPGIHAGDLFLLLRIYLTRARVLVLTTPARRDSMRYDIY